MLGWAIIWYNSWSSIGGEDLGGCEGLWLDLEDSRVGITDLILDLRLHVDIVVFIAFVTAEKAGRRGGLLWPLVVDRDYSWC